VQSLEITHIQLHMAGIRWMGHQKLFSELLVFLGRGYQVAKLKEGIYNINKDDITSINTLNMRVCYQSRGHSG
jgi:hypothetical protein